jgi:hypothetical protein
VSAGIFDIAPAFRAVFQSHIVTLADLEPGQRSALRRYGTWRRFHHGPRSGTDPLLNAVGRYPNAVLVAGCQRSGTTMLARIIARSPQFTRLKLTHDDELDAALALCGQIDLPAQGRYCFQTTYLNERFIEYRKLRQDQRLVWVLRNPYSVVYSMVHNWKRFALNELYQGCCLPVTTGVQAITPPWPLGPSSFTKACKAYAAKAAQILSIRTIVSHAQLLVVDYDALVLEPYEWLGRIFAFIGALYETAFASAVRVVSLSQASQLTSRQQLQIRKIAEPTCRQCLKIL